MNFSQSPGISGPAKGAFAPLSSQAAPTEASITLGQIIGILRRRIWMIAACILFFVVLTGGILSQLTPEYSANAQIKLDQQEGVNRSFQDLVTELDIDSKVIAGELAVIESGTLLARVVQKLDLQEDPEFNPDLWKKTWFEEQLGAVQRTVMGLIRPKTDPSLRRESEAVAAAAQAQSQITGEYSGVIGVLRTRMEARQVGNAYLVDVKVTSADPEKAAAIANTVVDMYIQEQLDSKFAGMRRVSSWLSGRMDDLSSRLRESEVAVQDFLAREVGVDGETAGLLQQQISELTSQLIAARADFAEAEAKNQMLQEIIRDRGVVAAADVFSSDIVSKNRSRLSELRSEAAEIQSRFGEDSSKLRPIRQEIESLVSDNSREMQRLVAEITNSADVARVRITLLETTLRTLRERQLEIGRNHLELRQLQRESEANQAIYEKFLTTFKESKELLDFQTADAKVISYAELPRAPSSPRIKVALALAVFAGLFGGCGIALLLALAQRGFLTPDELVEKTGLQVYGTFSQLPRGVFRKEPALVMRNDPQSRIADEARTLRSYLMLDGGREPQVVAVTSSVPDEGATTTATLLAMSYVQMGRSAVVVDTDFALRSATRLLGESEGPDLVAFLQKQATLGEVVRLSQKYDIHYVPVAEQVSDSSGLLACPAMDRLIEQLCNRFDIVILDTVPVGILPDGLVAVSKAQLALVAVRWRTTPAAALDETLGVLRRINAAAVGMVMTFVQRSEEAKYRYSGYRDYAKSYNSRPVAKPPQRKMAAE
ncbi:MAG: polysaccharide biosynthesis tyrosine autokinase [Pseudomonadota bacterium]